MPELVLTTLPKLPRKKTGLCSGPGLFEGGALVSCLFLDTLALLLPCLVSSFCTQACSQQGLCPSSLSLHFKQDLVMAAGWGSAGRLRDDCA
jgi:hypothetical protein